MRRVMRRTALALQETKYCHTGNINNPIDVYGGKNYEVGSYMLIFPKENMTSAGIPTRLTVAGRYIIPLYDKWSFYLYNPQPLACRVRLICGYVHADDCYGHEDDGKVPSASVTAEHDDPFELHLSDKSIYNCVSKRIKMGLFPADIGNSSTYNEVTRTYTASDQDQYSRPAAHSNWDIDRPLAKRRPAGSPRFFVVKDFKFSLQAGQQNSATTVAQSGAAHQPRAKRKITFKVSNRRKRPVRIRDMHCAYAREGDRDAELASAAYNAGENAPNYATAGDNTETFQGTTGYINAVTQGTTAYNSPVYAHLGPLIPVTIMLIRSANPIQAGTDNDGSTVFNKTHSIKLLSRVSRCFKDD